MREDMAIAMREHLLDFGVMLRGEAGRTAFGPPRKKDGWKSVDAKMNEIWELFESGVADDVSAKYEYNRARPYGLQMLERLENKFECARECMRRGYEGERDDRLRCAMDAFAQLLADRLELEYEKARQWAKSYREHALRYGGDPVFTEADCEDMRRR